MYCPPVPLSFYMDSAAISVPPGYSPLSGQDPEQFDYSRISTAALPPTQDFATFQEAVDALEASDDAVSMRDVTRLPPFASYTFPTGVPEFPHGFNCVQDCVVSAWSAPSACQRSTTSAAPPACGRMGVEVRKRSVAVPQNYWGGCPWAKDLVRYARCSGPVCPGMAQLSGELVLRNASADSVSNFALSKSLKGVLAEGLTDFLDTRQRGLLRVDILRVEQQNHTPLGSQLPRRLARSPKSRQLSTPSTPLAVRILFAVQLPTNDAADVSAISELAPVLIAAPTAMQALVAAGAVPSGATLGTISSMTATVNTQDAPPKGGGAKDGTSMQDIVEDMRKATAAAETVAELSRSQVPGGHCEAAASPRREGGVVPLAAVFSAGPSRQVAASLPVDLGPTSRVASPQLTHWVRYDAPDKSLFQLSQVFADFGYEPMAGASIPSSNGFVRVEHDSRVVFVTAPAPAARGWSWGTFIHSASLALDSTPTTRAATVWIVDSSRALASNFFDFDAEGWAVHCNGMGSHLGRGRGALTHRTGTLGQGISRYLQASEAALPPRPTAEDTALWYFQKSSGPWIRAASAATGGQLRLSLLVLAPSDAGAVRWGDAVPLVELECAGCPASLRFLRHYLPMDSPVSVGKPITVEVSLAASAWRRGSAAWSGHGEGRRRRPGSTHPTMAVQQLHRKASQVACECDIHVVLQGLTAVRVFGDATPGHEVVALDAVQWIAQPADGAIAPNCPQPLGTSP